jgi:aspartyl-tRNA(Asn)/glutamyl-tRNA(Gln) amidotransferase subunit A
MLAIIAGYHPSDESCVDRPVDDYVGALTGDLTGLRIGVELTNHFPEGSDPALRGCFDAAIAVLADRGAEIVEVTLPLYNEVTTALWVMMAAEALAYHRNDMQTRWEDYCATTRTSLGRAAFFSAADYVQAARVRRVAQRALGELFGTVDAIVMPTSSVGAPPNDLMRTPGSDRIWRTACFTGYWDTVGNPALVVPMGFTGTGLPLSLQLATRPFEEALALQIGDAYQSATDWHLRVPPMVMEGSPS